MKNKTLHLLLSISFLFFSNCKDFDYEFQGTNESFEMSSVIVGDNYKIYVYLPPDYSSNNQYPLIIGMDGDSEFFNIEDIVSDQIINKKIPSSIFVGIGYGTVSKNETLRNRDYTPSVTSDPEDYETGGAANFYAFIKDELIPKLVEKYAITNNGHTLLGHSFGGLFTHFAMFQNRVDNPFDQFISVGTSYWYDSGEIFKYEKKYAETHSDFDVKIYNAMGALEGAVMLNSFYEMKERLANRNYNSLIIKHQELESYGHSRSDYISYEKGLEYVFNH